MGSRGNGQQRQWAAETRSVKRRDKECQASQGDLRSGTVVRTLAGAHVVFLHDVV